MQQTLTNLSNKFWQVNRRERERETIYEIDDNNVPEIEIYRIVSNKALESTNNAIKPTSGQTILVSQTPDEQAKQGGGGCC
jgi:hypothetical protein